jgi:hypothetical protein
LNFALFQNGAQIKNGFQKSMFQSKLPFVLIFIKAFCQPQFMEEKIFDRFKMVDPSQNGRQMVQIIRRIRV